MGRAIERGTDTECYCVCCEDLWRVEYRVEMIMNVTMLVVRVWGGQYREEVILNVTVSVVRVCGGEYREELILNVTLFVVRAWGGWSIEWN